MSGAQIEWEMARWPGTKNTERQNTQEQSVGVKMWAS